MAERPDLPTVLRQVWEDILQAIREAGDDAPLPRERPAPGRVAHERIRLDRATAEIPGANATVKHIYAVRQVLGGAITDLVQRSEHHDLSKLQEPELSGFVPFVEMPEHGTPEYDARLTEMKPILAEHYHNNDHHPEHWVQMSGLVVSEDMVKSGVAISRMPLPALIEMLCDWKARAGNDPINWDYNIKRYGIEPQLEGVLRATAEHYEF
jgi:hypothetical protein